MPAHYLSFLPIAVLCLSHLVSADKSKVDLYTGGGCAYPVKPLQSFVGTCEGNCYQWSSFDSVNLVAGSDGVRCHIYRDSDCSDEIVDTGDVGSDGKCSDSAGANSIKCYSGC
ncbi:hypothetical protein AC579_9640 [Pseudocercospora musae]|uniref:Uncharacterized protein n=1 Tax=Pseudocercospora musae TaxID=113226 RepID=A0A139ITE9_9PEZI|nr:hypothetical protein AC579_9640 [Pseudocercospora musae]